MMEVTDEFFSGLIIFYKGQIPVPFCLNNKTLNYFRLYVKVMIGCHFTIGYNVNALMTGGCGGFV